MSESQERGEYDTYRFVPVNGDSSAVDVGGVSVFEVLESRVARFLGIAGLETKVKETTNAVLCGRRRVVHDETKAVRC